jgi:general secretion pathway protein I
MRQTPEEGSERGFTLLEVLVALTIVTLAFGVLAQIIQTGLRQSAAARSLAAASLLARSELGRIGVDVPLQAGQADGATEDGMRWHTEIAVVEGPGEDRSLALYQVQVTVAWGGSPAEQLMLTTLRTGFPSE